MLSLRSISSRQELENPHGKYNKFKINNQTKNKPCRVSAPYPDLSPYFFNTAPKKLFMHFFSYLNPLQIFK